MNERVVPISKMSCDSLKRVTRETSVEQSEVADNNASSESALATPQCHDGVCVLNWKPKRTA